MKSENSLSEGDVCVFFLLTFRSQILGLRDPMYECMHVTGTKTKAGSGHPTNFHLFSSCDVSDRALHLLEFRERTAPFSSSQIRVPSIRQGIIKVTSVWPLYFLCKGFSCTNAARSVNSADTTQRERRLITLSATTASTRS